MMSIWNRLGLSRPPIVTLVSTAAVGWSLFIGGVSYAAVADLVVLLVAGSVAEQVVPRWRWLLQFVGAGLVGEIIGHAWHPANAVVLIATCGLAGPLALLASRRFRSILVMFCGILAVMPVPHYVVAGAVILPFVALVVLRWSWAPAVVVVLTGVELILLRDSVGLGLVAGCLLALVPPTAQPVRALTNVSPSA